MHGSGGAQGLATLRRRRASRSWRKQPNRRC